jgi:hypothetical protein
MDEQLVRDCLRMYRERAAHFENEWRNSYNNGYDDPGYYGMAVTYGFASIMVAYALKGSKKTLAQFDYFRGFN